VSELAATIREAIAALAAVDPNRRRFGAAHHRYELAPPLAALAADVPELCEFATTVGAGGAGPYYGLLPLERAVRAPVDTDAGPAIPIAHLGCGYAAVMPIAGGDIWLDARALGIARPIAPSLTAFYLDWIDRALHGALPDAFVAAGLCPLPNALTGYFAAWETSHGLPSGSLAGDQLADALSQLGPGAIEIGAEPPLFVRGERADPCIACASLLENLGLPASVVAPGNAPIPIR
jgi:hypothetical protein